MPVSREQFIAEIGTIFPDYSPNQEVADQLGHLDLTTVTAPTSIGKNTVMNATGLPVVIGETIRQPRMNHGEMEQNGREYYFRAHELDAIVRDVRLGNYVQIGMGPAKNSFYGSRRTAYPEQGPVLIDIMPNQWASVRALPFKSIASTYLSVKSFEEWEHRAQARGIIAEEWKARLAEGRESLRAGLDDESMIFILNDELSLAATTLARVAKTREYDRREERKARNYAAAILRQLVKE